MLDYHLFKKAVKSGSKTKSRWYYWYYDELGKQIQKVCKGCSTKWDAEQFISSLPSKQESKCKVRTIAENMYVPGSKHLLRREQMGQVNTKETLIESRRYVKRIIDDFGDENLADLTVPAVMNLLWSLPYKSSWKNSYIKVLNEIYQEASWEGYNVNKPIFPRFKNNYVKADVLTDDELQVLLQQKNFRSETDYLFFLLAVSAGLRMSEVRAFRPCQLITDNSMVVVDGFMDKSNKVRNNYNKAGSKDDPKWRVAIIPPETTCKLHNYIINNCLDYNDFMFKYCGKPYRLEFAADLLQEALRKAQIEKKGRKLTMHSLRYTYVTKMREVMDAETVKAMVGHTNVKMTDYYTRMSLDSVQKKLLPLVPAAENFFKK